MAYKMIGTVVMAPEYESSVVTKPLARDILNSVGASKGFFGMPRETGTIVQREYQISSDKGFVSTKLNSLWNKILDSLYSPNYFGSQQEKFAEWGEWGLYIKV